MNRLSFVVLCVGMGILGCSSATREQGPLDPSQTPKVSQEEIDAQIRQGMEQGMQNMPPEMRKQMEEQMKKSSQAN